MGQKIYLESDMKEAKNKADTLRKAINKARFLITDARNRYIKEKTRARSKKAAEEKDALIHQPKFNVLNDYTKFEDIQEAYGVDMISEAERDKLEDLWEERENLKNKTVNGIYQGQVTEALRLAWEFVDGLWEDEIQEADVI